MFNANFYIEIADLSLVIIIRDSCTYAVSLSSLTLTAVYNIEFYLK